MEQSNDERYWRVALYENMVKLTLRIECDLDGEKTPLFFHRHKFNFVKYEFLPEAQQFIQEWAKLESAMKIAGMYHEEGKGPKVIENTIIQGPKRSMEEPIKNAGGDPGKVNRLAQNLRKMLKDEHSLSENTKPESDKPAE